MRKIAVVVASRANYGRLLSVLRAIDQHPKLQLQLITGASACGLPMEFKPDAEVQCQTDGDNLQAMALTTGLFLCQLGGVLDRLKPDIVLLHGDRHEVLAAATAAAYMNIPLAHTEGGDVSGTIDDKVRDAITALADIHFPVTDLSAQRLLNMGAKRIHTVGSTALDILADLRLESTLEEPPYIVVLHHPNTTDPEDINPLIEAVMSLPFHKVWVNANVDAGSKAMMRLVHRQDVEFAKNLPPLEYARLLKNCKCAVGNSSSFIKEAAFLGVGTVIVGNRQQGREMGRNVAAVRMDAEEIYSAVLWQAQQKHCPSYQFGNGAAGVKIANILAREELLSLS